ncbi:hypothetical protein ScPMuIL_009591 [Solemya velum]
MFTFSERLLCVSKGRYSNCLISDQGVGTVPELLGLCALALGIWAKVDEESLDIISDLGSTLNDAPVLISASSIVLLVGGAVILLIAILGCCGAMKQWKWMLCLYAFCLLVILIVELTAAVLAIIYKKKIDDELKSALQKQMKENYGKPDDGFTTSMNKLQLQEDCCGLDGYKDYDNTDYDWKKVIVKTDQSTNGTQLIPASCCRPKDHLKDDLANFEAMNEYACTVLLNRDELYENGCYETLKEKIISKSAVLIGIGIAIVVVEIFGFIFACCLIAAIRREKVV